MLGDNQLQPFSVLLGHDRFQHISLLQLRLPIMRSSQYQKIFQNLLR